MRGLTPEALARGQLFGKQKGEKRTCSAFSSSSCDSTSFLKPIVAAVTRTTSSNVMRTSYRFTVSLSSAMLKKSFFFAALFFSKKDV